MHVYSQIESKNTIILSFMKQPGYFKSSQGDTIDKVPARVAYI